MGRMGLGGALGNSRGVVGVSVRVYRMALAGFGVVLGGFLNVVAGLGRTGGFGVFTIQAICTHLDGLCVPWVATKPAGGVSGMVTGFAAWRPEA